MPQLEGATLDERLVAGLHRVVGVVWVHPDNGVAYDFRLEPRAPPRISVSTMEGGIHVVPLPPGRFLAGLGDQTLVTLVQEALDRQDEANWASEGGAVRESAPGGPERDAPEV